MKISLFYLILSTLLIGYAPAQAQPTSKEALVSIALQHPAVQSYFEAFPTYYILNTPACNQENLSVQELKADKDILFGNREDFFMRNVKEWIAFEQFQVEEEMVTITARLVGKSVPLIIKLAAANGRWEFRSERNAGK